LLIFNISEWAFFDIITYSYTFQSKIVLETQTLKYYDITNFRLIHKQRINI